MSIQFAVCKRRQKSNKYIHNSSETWLAKPSKRLGHLKKIWAENWNDLVSHGHDTGDLQGGLGLAQSAAQYKPTNHTWQGNIDDQSVSIKTKQMTGSRQPLPGNCIASAEGGGHVTQPHTEGGDSRRVSSAGYNGSCHVVFGARPTTTVVSENKQKQEKLNAKNKNKNRF